MWTITKGGDRNGRGARRGSIREREEAKEGDERGG